MGKLLIMVLLPILLFSKLLAMLFELLFVGRTIKSVGPTEFVCGFELIIWIVEVSFFDELLKIDASGKDLDNREVSNFG